MNRREGQAQLNAKISVSETSVFVAPQIRQGRPFKILLVVRPRSGALKENPELTL